MGVGAAKPEGGDAGAARSAVASPLSKRRLHAEGCFGEVDVGIGRQRMERGGEGLVLQLQQHLAHARYAGRRLEVADVWLDRADRAAAGWLCAGEGQRKRPHLDGITEFCAGAMGLNVADRGRLEVRPGECCADDALLREHRGCRVAAGAPAGVDGAALQHREDRITVALGIGERAQQDRADALAHDEALAAGTEGARFVVGRQHPVGRHQYMMQRVHEEVDASGDRRPTVAPSDRLGRHVYGTQ